MRIALVALVSLLMTAAFQPASADPYRWCAQYSGFAHGGSCYYVTIEQCRAAISGMGGFCRENGFYDGRPVSTEGQPQMRRRR